MLARKSLLLWSFVSVLGLSATAVPSVYRSLCPPIVPPRSLPELTELLSQAEPELLVVSVTPSTPENGVWVCERSLPREQLSRMLRTPSYAPRWQGVVLCEIPPEHWNRPEDEIEGWGEHFMQIGPLQCFGDPALLRRIHKAILDHQEEK
jgi:hypothetical protein